MSKLEPRSPRDGILDHAGYDRWVASRPPEVKRLMTEFPAGTVVTDPKGNDLYVIGWTEGDLVLLSPVWIFPNYEEAMAKKVRAHASHLRDGEAPIKRWVG